MIKEKNSDYYTCGNRKPESQIHEYLQPSLNMWSVKGYFFGPKVKLKSRLKPQNLS